MTEQIKYKIGDNKEISVEYDEKGIAKITRECLEMLIEKQIPKEIEQFIVDGKMGRRCPNGCDITEVTMWVTLNYCPYCGQKLD